MKIAVSFVHGYRNLNVSQHDLARPCLMITDGKKVDIKKYIFQETLVILRYTKK